MILFRKVIITYWGHLFYDYKELKPSGHQLIFKWSLPLCLQTIRNFLTVFGLLMEKAYRQLGKAEIAFHIAQRAWVSSMQTLVLLLPIPSRAVLSLLRHSWRALVGAVFFPCGQLCLRGGGFPPLKLLVSFPAGLLHLPSRAIWMVNREERLWEPNDVSLASEPVAFSSGRTTFILSDFAPFFKRQ